MSLFKNHVKINHCGETGPCITETLILKISLNGSVKICSKHGSLTPYSGYRKIQFSLWVMPDSATPWTSAQQASLSITNSQNLLQLMSIESVMPSNLILWHPLLLPPSILPSIRVFSNESVLRIRWPKYWSFSFSISPSNEYSELISFRIDWLDLLGRLERKEKQKD